MTKSEIHAVMTGGFATIAGSVLAAYIRLVKQLLLLIFVTLNLWLVSYYACDAGHRLVKDFVYKIFFLSFGVSASHLLSASVMSAPAALAFRWFSL